MFRSPPKRHKRCQFASPFHVKICEQSECSPQREICVRRRCPSCCSFPSRASSGTRTDVFFRTKIPTPAERFPSRDVCASAMKDVHSCLYHQASAPRLASPTSLSDRANKTMHPARVMKSPIVFQHEPLEPMRVSPRRTPPGRHM